MGREYRGFNWPRPVFELALRWLAEHDPGPSKEVTLVHGDFRHGNLIIGPDDEIAVTEIAMYQRHLFGGAGIVLSEPPQRELEHRPRPVEAAIFTAHLGDLLCRRQSSQQQK